MTTGDDVPTIRAPGDDDDEGGLESRVLLARARVKLLGRAPQPVGVGRYHILDRLGQGGMGVVYLARDDELDRKVAIKILKNDLARGSAGRSRLLREAQATAKLSHPNVVHVYEVGHEADQVYMAMEYVEGSTLRKWNEQPRTWYDVVAMYVGAGEALAAAHAAGLVHRDFKPDNVLVGRDGRPRVVDFGLARIDDVVTTREQAVAQRDTAPRKSVDVTATATFAGTPAYMAPELHAYHRADARSDQFAFCVSLFEALYGRRPFGGDTITEIAEQVVLTPPVPIDPAERGVPRAIHDALLRGLARRPTERFPGMVELLAELRRASMRPPKRTFWPFAALGIGALGLAAALQWSPTRAPAPESVPSEIESNDPRASWDAIVAATDLPRTVPTAVPGDATGVTVHRLRNGLTLYLAERPLEPVVQAHIAVRAGIGDVAPQDMGLSSLVLDGMMQGSERLGTADAAVEGPLLAIEHALLYALEHAEDPRQRADIEQLVEAAQLGARSLRLPYETITIGNELGFRRQTMIGAAGATMSAEVPSHRVGAWVEIVAEMIQRPSFRAFRAASAQRLELVRWLNEDSLADRAGLQVLSPIIGNTYDPQLAAETIRSLPLRRAQEYHRTWFRPNNTAIVLVGAISAAEAIALLERHFGDWEPAELPRSPFVPSETMAARTARTVAAGGAAMVELAWPMPPSGSDESRAIAALGHAMGGRDGIVAPVLGVGDPEDVDARVAAGALRLRTYTAPDAPHDDLETRMLAAVQAAADDRVPQDMWSRVLPWAELRSRRWARSQRNLALRMVESFMAGEEWEHTARLLSEPITRADIVAGAKALLQRPRAVVDVEPGEAWSVDIDAIPSAPLQLVLDRRSEWARRLLDEPTTPVEPRFLVAGSHYRVQSHGAGRVIATKADGPLFYLTWVVPLGSRAEPWACDAMRTKVRALAVPGIDALAKCYVDDTRIEIIGPSERFAAAWPQLVEWMQDPQVAPALVRGELEDAVRVRSEARSHGVWGTEAAHLFALRGEQGIDAQLPDDATLRRRGEVEIPRALHELAAVAPDILYAGPDPDVLLASLPAPSDRAGVPPQPYRFRTQDEPTIVLLHQAGRPHAEVRVLVPQIAAPIELAAQYDLAAQMYEFMGDVTGKPDDALMRQELQVWVPPPGGGPILHGAGFRAAPQDLDAAIEAGLAVLQRPPDPAGFATARARVEADFRAVRVPATEVPVHVHRWGRAAQQDPRVAQWLALPGMSYEVFERYVQSVARATPYISVVADVDTIDAAALRRHGRVIQVELDDVLREAAMVELDVLGVSLVSTEMD